MKYAICLPIIAGAFLLAGCSRSVPECGDADVTGLVKQIADREMGNQLGAEAAEMFSYAVQVIRTLNTDEKTGAHECAAELDINASTGGSSSIPITYTVELTDDGDQIYVNVFGL